MKGFTTKTIHTGYEATSRDGAVIPPLHLSTTFKIGNEKNYDYSRSANPTREVLEAVLAAIDGNEYAYAFSSGSAALAAVVGLLKPGEKLLCSSDVYGGTYRYVATVAGASGVEFEMVDFLDKEQTESALKTGDYRIVWLETPSNPMLRVTDIEWLANVSHENGAILAVDNTFATPIIQLPKDHGADLVVYSTTKYINGHSDSIGGSVSTSDKEIGERLQYLQNAMGNMLSPFDSWLTLRGLKTLELRVQRHLENADAVLELLRGHDKVENLHYPGENDPEQAKTVKKQMKHGGAMISFELDKDADPQVFIDALKHIPLAESLGGIESLLDHPASMTHASIPKEEREKIGISDGLFRISVGIENKDDLVSDLENALDQI